MAYKPIIFSAPQSIPAIMDGRKTMTRRVVKGAYPYWRFETLDDCATITKIRANGDEYGIDVEGTWATFYDADGVIEFPMIKAPYQVGDVLWVKEAFRVDYLSNIVGTGRVHYKADDSYHDICFAPEQYDVMRRANKHGWRSPRYMPKAAARNFLLVTAVRVDRLQDILCGDMKREGCIPATVTGGQYEQWQREYFKPLWDSLNAKRDGGIYAWDKNPWVWVYTFKKIPKPEGWCA